MSDNALAGQFPLILHAQPGYGSVLIEAQLSWYGVEYELRPAGPILEDPAARSRLTAINPVAQLPAFEAKDGLVMTESAAITLWLAETYGSPGRSLVPEARSAQRASFLRWLIYWVASPYAVFTYLDRSAELVPDARARSDYEAALRHRLEMLLKLLEQNAGSPWFLGEQFSALDIYAAVFSEWTPGPGWYAAQAPRLAQIARRTWDIDVLQPVHASNFKLKQ